MQASFTFNLPEDADLFRYHCKVMDYRSVIDDFRRMLRSWEKSDQNPGFELIKAEFQKLLAGIEYE